MCDAFILYNAPGNEDDDIVFVYVEEDVKVNWVVKTDWFVFEFMKSTVISVIVDGKVSVNVIVNVFSVSCSLLL